MKTTILCLSYVWPRSCKHESHCGSMVATVFNLFSTAGCDKNLNIWAVFERICTLWLVTDKPLHRESQWNEAIGTGANLFCHCRLPWPVPQKSCRTTQPIHSVGKVKADIGQAVLNFLTDKLLVVYSINRNGSFNTLGSPLTEIGSSSHCFSVFFFYKSFLFCPSPLL